MKKYLFTLLIIIGVLVMLKPINSIIKDSIGNIMFRGNVVTGTVAVDNGDGSYDVFISESDIAYPKIFTLSRNPDLAVGDKVRILYKNGCKELPIILPPATTAPEEHELTFNNNYRAVCIHAGTYSVDTTYAEVYNKYSSNAAYGNSVGLQIKQDSWFPSGSYHRFDIYRGFLYWDTSSIPAGATITSAEIHIYVSHNYTYRTHNMVVQNGQPTFPYNPIQKSNYYHGYYSGNGGEIASSAISTSAWNIITLNDDGKSWINIGGETKLCLRVNRDINNDSPGYAAEGEAIREEGIRLIGDPVDTIYAKLIVKYTEAN